ncbi:MAG: hypothetical protein ACSHYF_05285 [Verrucomicrobiaceae bacterium]
MRKGTWFGLLLGLAGVLAIGYGYYRYEYPYGSTHRCSKVLAMELRHFANTHDGRFPVSGNENALGLSELLVASPEYLELVVGKAGDLGEAREFFEEHGYLLPEHSSWHYVEGLSSNEGRALAWDKIPLDHNGRRTDDESREVIMTNGSVENVKGKDWDDFLARQSD